MHYSRAAEQNTHSKGGLKIKKERKENVISLNRPGAISLSNAVQMLQEFENNGSHGGQTLKGSLTWRQSLDGKLDAGVSVSFFFLLPFFFFYQG